VEKKFLENEIIRYVGHLYVYVCMCVCWQLINKDAWALANEENVEENGLEKEEDNDWDCFRKINIWNDEKCITILNGRHISIKCNVKYNVRIKKNKSKVLLTQWSYDFQRIGGS
jgi:hypothetical protein